MFGSRKLFPARILARRATATLALTLCAPIALARRGLGALLRTVGRGLSAAYPVAVQVGTIAYPIFLPRRGENTAELTKPISSPS